MSRSVIIAAGLALLAAAWVASGQLSGIKAENIARKPPADLARDDTLPQVRVRRQSAVPYRTAVVLRGRTEALRKVEARAETHGRVIELAVERGMVVAEGDVLVRLAPEDRPARLAEAKALLEQRRIEHQAAEKLSAKGFRADTQLAASLAELESAQAAVERAQVDLDNTVIRAPFAGFVEDRMVDLGDFLEMGDTVASLVDLDPVLVVGQVSERDIGRLAVGSPGTARLMTGERVDGRIRYIARVADPVTRTFRVELEVANPDGGLRDGVTAEVVLPGPSVLAHRVSPAVLSLSTAGTVGVKVVDADQTVRFVPVQIVEQSEDGLWLLGLPDEVTLITVGQDFVSDGQQVRTVGESTLAPSGPAAGEG
jgi:multidrug efflux system membrane fusion protein